MYLTQLIKRILKPYNKNFKLEDTQIALKYLKCVIYTAIYDVLKLDILPCFYKYKLEYLSADLSVTVRDNIIIEKKKEIEDIKKLSENILSLIIDNNDIKNNPRYEFIQLYATEISNMVCGLIYSCGVLNKQTFVDHPAAHNIMYDFYYGGKIDKLQVYSYMLKYYKKVDIKILKSIGINHYKTLIRNRLKVQIIRELAKFECHQKVRTDNRLSQLIFSKKYLKWDKFRKMNGLLDSTDFDFFKYYAKQKNMFFIKEFDGTLTKESILFSDIENQKFDYDDITYMIKILGRPYKDIPDEFKNDISKEDKEMTKYIRTIDYFLYMIICELRKYRDNPNSLQVLYYRITKLSVDIYTKKANIYVPAKVKKSKNKSYEYIQNKYVGYGLNKKKYWMSYFFNNDTFYHKCTIENNGSENSEETDICSFKNENEYNEAIENYKYVGGSEYPPEYFIFSK